MTRPEPGRRRRSRAEQQQMVARFNSSGLSAAAFCRQHGIRYGSLLRWRRSATVQRREFVELVAAPGELPRPGWCLEVRLPNGTCLRLRE